MYCWFVLFTPKAFPLSFRDFGVHAKHEETDLEVVAEDLTVDVQGMRVGSAVHFTLGLLLQNPYRGYMPLHLLALLSLYSGGQWEARRTLSSLPGSCSASSTIYVLFYQMLRNATLIIM